MNIDEAPRDVKALRELPEERRLDLFVQLVKESEDSPSLPVFACWDAQQQAAWLLTQLLSHDDADAEYVAVGVSLPVFTAKAHINKKRWGEFAEELASALNGLRANGCQDISTAYFSPHGVVVTGFRPPTVGPEESVSFQALSEQVTLRALVNSMYRHITLSRKPRKEAILDAVEEVLHPSSTQSLQRFVRFAEDHCSGCSEKLGDLLVEILVVVKDSINRSLS